MRTAPDLPVEQLGALYVAVVADVLDRLGLRTQVLDHRIRPVTQAERVAGRAFPVQAVPNGELLENPYEREIAAVDAVPAGAVIVFATGGCDDAAIWGELLATRTLARGGVGAVVDGGVRDVAGLRTLGIPTFAASITARDSAGRLAVVAHGVPVAAGGVTVRPGDIVLGDADGVVVVPAEAAADAVAAAEDKRSKEAEARALLERGGSVAEVYARHGVL